MLHVAASEVLPYRISFKGARLGWLAGRMIGRTGIARVLLANKNKKRHQMNTAMPGSVLNFAAQFQVLRADSDLGTKS